jgi:uncharacterized RDD family membrane protein YckC
LKLDSISIESPEKIVFQYAIAKTGARMAAYLLDILLQIMVAALLVIFFVLFGIVDTQTFKVGGIKGFGNLAIAFFYLIYFFFQWGYFSYFELFKHGRSPGKRMMRIRVIKDNGEALDASSIVLRNLLRAVDGFPVFHFLGGLVSILDKQSRRLGDMVSGTLVVLEQDFDLKEPSFETKLTTPARKETPLRLEKKLSEQQLLIIRKFLAGRVHLSEEKQQELGKKLAAQVKEATGAVTTIQDPVEFLEEIYRSHSHED